VFVVLPLGYNPGSGHSACTKGPLVRNSRAIITDLVDEDEKLLTVASAFALYEKTSAWPCNSTPVRSM
jgi:hypothetical protein